MIDPRISPVGLGIYVHFPWCLVKCPYCDFHSVALQRQGSAEPTSVEQARALVPHERYADAVIAELVLRATEAWPLQERPQVSSLFFGGGTPSLWTPAALGRVLARARSEFDVKPDFEVTVECNPSSVSEQHFFELLDAGVNRVSIGVQALDDERLHFLGRLHRASRGLEAISLAQAAGFENISADLIFGVYRQPKELAVRDAIRVARSGVAHISAYSLTIEEGTRFGALHAKGKLPLLDDAQAADSFEAVSAALQQEGFTHYEISNYARTKRESVHNLGYWMGRDYLGLGSGAVGTITLGGERVRYKNLLSPERYLDAWSSPRHAPFQEQLAERETIEPETAMDEALMLGLRTSFGVDLAEVARVRAAPPLGRERAEELERLHSEGFLESIQGRLTLRRNRWLVADHVLRRLL